MNFSKSVVHSKLSPSLQEFTFVACESHSVGEFQLKFKQGPQTKKNLTTLGSIGFSVVVQM